VIVASGLAPPLAPSVIAERIALPRPVQAVLAVGAYLKNTLCLARDTEALVSCDVGDLGTAEAVCQFEACAERFLASAKDGPRPGLAAVAHDLHPNFHSTRYGQALADRLGIEAIGVQHHHAHVAAVMAEHGREEPTLGLALDGFGLGPNQESWGGELLLVTRDGYRRLGHLALLPQPGGDKAAREPWRMGAAVLHVLGRGGEIERRFGSMTGAAVIARMLERNVNCPPTSSCGRLFDAACGLLGIKPIARFEGEAPMALERLATRLDVDPDGWRIAGGVLDLTPLLARLIALEAEQGAALFHGTLIRAMAAWVTEAVENTGIVQVVLSGGCFFNKVLREGLAAALADKGIAALLPLRLSPGDTALSLGQAWAVAMAKG
jgi:hydrogenase maturation protein HypF